MVYVDSRPEPNCSYCKGELDSQTAPFCKECGHPIHLDCWEGFGGCATPFCVESPGFDKSLESPEGRTQYIATFPAATKFCPACGSERVGVFCGLCGLDFVALDTRKAMAPGGRSLDELLSEAATKLEHSKTVLTRSKKFKKNKNCLNCGFDLSGETQCSRCLYEG